VLCAWSEVAFAPSAYPSGLDHQLCHAHVFEDSCGLGGSGGNGGSLIVGTSGGAFGVSFSFDSSTWSTDPSEETCSFVMDAGMALPLLDLRFDKNLVGDGLSAAFCSSLGSSIVAPPVTPTLSLASFATVGAFDLQLPVPPSHLRLGFLFRVGSGAVVGREVLLDVAIGGVESGVACVFFKDAFSCGVLADEFGAGSAEDGSAGATVPSAAGAWGLGLDFLRGLMPGSMGRRSSIGRRDSGRVFPWGIRPVAVLVEAAGTW
jgi:hypothetical protein